MFIAYQFIIARKHRNNCWFANWPTYPEGKERRKKTASQWTREHVGGLQDEQISIPTCWTLKVYVEALPGFSQIFSPDGLNSTSHSQGCILENGSHCGTVNTAYNSEKRGGDEEPPSDWIQLMVQLMVMSPQWPPPTTDTLQ